MPWEVDWTQRRRVGTNSQVWARNPESIQVRARDWHWATWMALRKAGVKWLPVKERNGRYVNGKGYVELARGAMSSADIALADRECLWAGKRASRVLEHQLVAAHKYGRLPESFVVRHRNGDKTDNRPCNLLLGTRKDNARDHHEAVREMMYWRERAIRAEGGDPVKVLSF